MSLILSQTPLERISESGLRQLSFVLWFWPTDLACHSCGGCANDDCLTRRSKRLVHFFNHYKYLTASFEHDTQSAEQQVLRSHKDLFKIIQTLKSDPDIPRSQLTKNCFTHYDSGSSGPQHDDQERAVDLAVRAMFFINCSAEHQSFHLLEHNADRLKWRDDITFNQFVSEAFSMTDHPSLNDNETTLPVSIKKALLARKLKKVAGLTFRGTDDLRNHFKLDHKTGVVKVFHHTSFLKEHLRLTKDGNYDASLSESLKKGALPRQLVLEVLDSIQKILFDLSDPKSYSLLRSLTSAALSDPDCLRYESASFRSSDEENIQYLYFGSRLVDLYEESKNPRPRGWMNAWLQRKSGARYMMMATLIGVAIAIFLGITSLAVEGYQAWISYQQWQHPISG
ncbi:MAG: hypothetical protein MMC33_005083 [Icmadophila ericetorum]|nr:hypothetical protein [Icmadophila ericetorum]